MYNKELVSPCGLYCGVCGIRYADKKNDVKLKEKLAAAYHDKPEKIACNGCRSANPYWFCASCPIKSCAAEKNYEGCYQCADFPCEKITNFPIPEAKRNILRAVPRWKELGTEAWIKEEERLFSCKNCGNTLFRGAKKCRECGTMME